MTSLARYSLWSISTVGASSAVAVPLVTLNKYSSDQFLNGGGHSLEDIGLAQCNFKGFMALEVINYGEGKTEDVCWTVDTTGKTRLSDQGSRKYSSFFQEEWQLAKREANNLNSDRSWLQQCDGAAWVILPPDGNNKIRRLGFCENSDVESTKFVKVDRTGSENATILKFWACEKDCWLDLKKQGELYLLQKAKNQNWKEVKFLRNN